MAELEFQKRPKLLHAFGDSMLMIKRSSTHIIRNTDQLLGTFFQPIMFLVLFTAVYSGAINTGGTDYTNYLMAGIIIQTIALVLLPRQLPLRTIFSGVLSTVSAACLCRTWH